jgi:hypothetical protein
LSLYFDPASGDLRYLRLGDREVLRRVYVAVRDREWGTVPPTVTGMHVEEQEDSFSLRFLVVHHRDEIRFGWAGEVSGDATGRIVYSMVGQPLASFLTNRTGICVLHPAQECAGLPCTVEHTDGSTEEGRFPLYIAPHQPFKDIRRLTYPVAPGVNATITFEGDVFEMEDQRNWTDASFKTYCTPLELPFPKLLRAGVQVAQTVTITLEGQPARPPARPAPSRPRCLVGDDPLGILPEIGLGVAPGPETHGEAQITHLEALQPSHLRQDLELDGEWEEALWDAAGLAHDTGAPLELALYLGAQPQEQLEAVAHLLPELDVPVKRVLVYYDEGTESAEHELLLAQLAQARPETRLGGGTYRYFTELNRTRPDLRWADFVCYSLSPQVHAFDHVSLVETLPMHAWTVACTRRLYTTFPVAVSPVTLTPRPKREPGATGRARPAADPRQPSLFTAAWVVGSLKYLAQAGARSVTYFETAGPAGIMDSAEPGRVYPVYHVLADVLEHPGALVLPTLSADPLRVESLALRWSDRTRVLVANLSLEPLEVEVSGLGQVAWVRHLDETTAEQALGAPDEFRAAPWTEQSTHERTLVVALPACGVVTIDTW